MILNTEKIIPERPIIEKLEKAEQAKEKIKVTAQEVANDCNTIEENIDTWRIICGETPMRFIGSKNERDSISEPKKGMVFFIRL